MNVAEPKAGVDGRYAEGIFQIPPGAWMEILKRTVRDVGRNNLSLIAGGATFFLLLAIFPALAAFVALYGLVFDVAAVQEHVTALTGVLPAEAIDLVSEQLSRLASQNEGTLGIGFAVGLGVALWSANAGVKALFAAMNVVYGEEEKRGFVKLTLISLAFTLAAIVAAAILLGAIVVVPAVLAVIGLQSTGGLIIDLARWPILFVVLLSGLSLLFRYGASRRPPRLRWVVWGSVLTAALWVAASAAFSFYLANFANYNATYGSLGAVIGFMMWLYVSLMILLIGAELNAEVEHQLITDTTVGPMKPMGERRAVVADTLPDTAEVSGAR
ncbi:YihY/virulence factor BrkB family protein [Acuticoccus sp. I52.16.1]|uniref:YihY/virulence factor BrkB family protein n=1 Tax=Acuticoccus sp. I52.16.1 TaxID=2928472 RepID=UPI001FD23C0A|nr:YihY/virulence factor BrkB family protein [Acuticoccus sp. I52.16.1]UOM35178.1 YihY/virulence factor BrkB family protein [Acuticoccus sp. I52.16.1]